MKKYAVYIKDTEPHYGDEFFMEFIEKDNYKEARQMAIRNYGGRSFC